jgi:hypothetical protein
MERTTDVIREADALTPVMVGGLQFAYDLAFVTERPVRRDNVVYVTHPYPNANWRIDWDEAFGDIAARYPVFATELGYDDDGYRIDEFQGAGAYPETLMAYLDERGIGWTAWSFSGFPPALLADDDYTPTEAGEFFRGPMLAAGSR